jgi:hypothetical protein
MTDRPTPISIRAAGILAVGLLIAGVLTPVSALAAAKPAATPVASAKTAASTAATATVPLGSGELEVQLWPSQTSALLLVSLRLPETVALPARVRMPLPAGAQVTWSGEITGGDAASDIKRPYTIVSANGGQAIEFVAQQSRDLQYEADLPDPTVAGNRVTTALTWVQTTEALGVDPAVKTPAGATGVEIKPAPALQPRTNSAGEALYTLPQQRPAIGASFAIDVSFQQGVPGAPASAPSPAAPGTSPVVWILLAVLLIVVAVVVVMALRAGLSSSPSDED